MFCKNCGKNIANAEFCGGCGTKVTKSAASPQPIPPPPPAPSGEGGYRPPASPGPAPSRVQKKQKPNMTIIVLLSLVTLIVIGMLAVWRFGSSETIDAHTLRFYLNDGSEALHVQRAVEDGDTVSLPQPPSRSGYDFIEWTEDRAGNRPFDAAAPVRDDIDLFAQWGAAAPATAPAPSPSPEPTAPVMHTITFQLNDGTGDVHTAVSVPDGSLAALPVAPEREGYEFVHWATSAAGVQPFVLTTPVQSDLTLFAHWQEEAQPSPSPTSTSYVTTANLHFRAGPSMSARSFEVVPRGTTVEVVGYTHADDRLWLRVSRSGRTGYMAAEFLSLAN